MDSEPATYSHKNLKKYAAPGMGAAYAAALSMLLVCMSVFTVNMALSTITENLGGNMALQQWMISGYTLPFAALLIASGSISDRIGAKKTLMFAALAYGLVSAVCPFAQSMEMLVCFQIVLGSIGAFMLPSSMALIGETYSEGSRRSHALMLWGIGGSSASAVGPLAGGALVQVHWGLAFVINVPFCILIALLCTNAPNRIKSTERKPVDMQGLLLGTMGLAAFVGGIISISDSQNALFPVSLCILGCAILASFILHEDKAKQPVLPLSLFREKTTRLALFGGFAMIFAWNGSVFSCTLLLQNSLGLSSLESGYIFAPATMTCMLGNVIGEKLVMCRGVKFPLVFGSAILFFGYLVLAICSHSINPIAIAAAMSLAGMGGAIVTPVLASLVLIHGGANSGGTASAAFNAMRQVGGTIGVAIYGVTLNLAPSFENGSLIAAIVSLTMLAIMIIGFIRIR